MDDHVNCNSKIRSIENQWHDMDKPRIVFFMLPSLLKDFSQKGQTHQMIRCVMPSCVNMPQLPTCPIESTHVRRMFEWQHLNLEMISKLFLNKRIWPFQTANPLVKIFDQIFQRKVLNLVQSERNLYFPDVRICFLTSNTFSGICFKGYFFALQKKFFQVMRSKKVLSTVCKFPSSPYLIEP